ncbi:pullulanase [Eubacterium ruminantium]|nr:pullulanase [Eubacterium ruminantium]
MKKLPLLWKKYYKENKNKPEFRYAGQLGARVVEDGTVIRLWSPVAEEVRLNLYMDGGEGRLIKNGYGMLIHEDSDADNAGLVMTVPMTYDRKNGIWVYVTSENLAGAYYDFDITIEGTTKRSADPYAIASGVNGARSMILPRNVDDPENWKDDKSPLRQDTRVIYEINVREFSYQLEMGEDSGKYTAFKRFATGEKFRIKGTDKYINPFEHMKKLGVTHVQLMPSYDFGSVDERYDTEDFNWGYDPVNYNVPEGSFSKDPYSGETRIKEFKEMVQALHSAGFRVVMDVVYNHSYNLDNSLQQTAPWYYYRVNTDGTISDGSHCGNDIASERWMTGRFILNSVMYWAEEYHIDGFRFDLMGLLDTELMNEVRKSLDDRFGEGEKIVYGEPWAADETAMEDGFIPALKKNVERRKTAVAGIGLTDIKESARRVRLDKNIGFFSDDIRDDIKGSVFDEKSTGFVNGGCIDQEMIDAINAKLAETGELREEDKIQRRIEEAIADAVSAYHKQGLYPSQILRYVSSHDDLTLWDKLTITTEDEDKRKKQNKLAAAVYILGQGSIFMLSGEEFLRTKGGESNSYNLPITLNRLDWERCLLNQEMVDYYSKLIEIRKGNAALSDTGSEAWKRIEVIKEDNGVVAFKAEELFVIFNTNETKAFVPVPEGLWDIILGDPDEKVNDKSWGERVRCVRPISVTVYRKLDKSNDFQPSENWGQIS